LAQSGHSQAADQCPLSGRHQLNVLQQRAPRRLYLTWADCLDFFAFGRFGGCGYGYGHGGGSHGAALI
jgi:hypothetical protein